MAYAEMFFGMEIRHPTQELLENVDWALAAIEKRKNGLCLEPPNKECTYFVDNILDNNEAYSEIEESKKLLMDPRNRITAKLENTTSGL